MNELLVSEVRRRLGEISDELRSMADDDFPAKHRLNLEADSLREQLVADLDHDSEAILEEWAERAGRKGSHTVDYDLELAKASIVSPIEGGGSA